jgi:hypothetical protein
MIKKIKIWFALKGMISINKIDDLASLTIIFRKRPELKWNINKIPESILNNYLKQLYNEIKKNKSPNLHHYSVIYFCLLKRATELTAYQLLLIRECLNCQPKKSLKSERTWFDSHISKIEPSKLVLAELQLCSNVLKK